MASRSHHFTPLTTAQQGIVVAAERGAFQPVTRGMPLVREDRDDDEITREPVPEAERDVFENSYMWDEDEEEDERGAGVPLRQARFDPSSASRGALDIGP